MFIADAPCRLPAEIIVRSGGFFNVILLTGYQDAESPGRPLLESAAEGIERRDERAIRLGGVPTAVRREVASYGLSAHADRIQPAARVAYSAISCGKVACKGSKSASGDD